MEPTPPATPASPPLTIGDWVSAAVALLLTPLVSVPLCLYNFAHRRPRQGRLYLGVLVVQFVAFLVVRMTLVRYAPYMH